MWVQITLFIFIIIGLIVYIIIRIATTKSIQKIDIAENSSLFKNPCRTKFTNSYYEGFVKNILKRKNGCSLVEFYPTDVKQGEFVPRPDIQSVVVRSEFLIPSPEGTGLSGRRNIITAVSKNPMDYPEEVRDSIEGKWMMKEGQKAWLLSTFGETIPNGDEAIAEMQKDYARGNMTKAELERMKELINEKMKLLLIPNQKEENKEK